MRGFVLLAIAGMLACSTAARGQAFTPAEIAGIDRGVEGFLAQRGVPSASVAVVRGGKIVFAKAYGRRTVSPDRPASLEARYNIASVSKQMTATALLMLVDEGRLSLDDTIDRWLPELTEARRITVRQVLSHTAGYKGFFHGEFLSLEGHAAKSPRAIADEWATQPLDFPPGTDWSYSNTDYTIAGLIVEKVSGRPLAAFLKTRIFAPLGMASAGVVPAGPTPPADAQGYTRYALGPLRPSGGVGAGWGFGDGGLVMSATDLARWDVGVLRHSLLSARTYAAQQTAVPLAGGKTAPYGLGVFVDQVAGHKRVKHPGSEEGFLTENRIYPDDGAAVAVSVNADFGDAQDDIADQIERLILGLPTPPKRDPRRARPNIDAAVRPQDVVLAHRMFDQLASGTLDRSRLTAEAKVWFTPTAVADYRASLGPLGPPMAFERLQSAKIDGQDVSIYRLMWANQWAAVVMRVDPDGQVAVFKVFAPV